MEKIFVMLDVVLGVVAFVLLVLIVRFVWRLYESGEEGTEEKAVDCDYCKDERFVVSGSRGDKLPCPRCNKQDRHF